jgi:hypothetical protein
LRLPAAPRIASLAEGLQSGQKSGCFLCKNCGEIFPKKTLVKNFTICHFVAALIY